MTAPPPAWKVWTALGIVYVVWGSTYLGIRYVVGSLPALLSASTRFLLAGILLGGYVLVRRGPGCFSVTARQLGNCVLIGLLLLLGGNGGIALAVQSGLPSGVAALFAAAIPLWVVVLRMIDRDRPPGRTLVGVAIGFCGLAVLLGPGARPAGVGGFSVGLCLCAGLLWSLGSFLGGRLDLPADPLVASVLQMLGGAAGLAVAGVFRSEHLDIAHVRLSSVLGLGYLVVFGSVLAFTAFSWLLGVAPVSKVSTYAYVNPVVAVLLGALFVGERVTVTAVVGGGLTLLAVAVVVSEEGRRGTARVASLMDVPVAPGQTPEELQGRERSSAT